MAAGILWFGHEYIDPSRAGIPAGIDLGNDLSYLGTMRSELVEEGRLLTWWSVAYDGVPLVGHPNSQFFYPPLILPSLAFGTATGARIAYIFSLLLAGGGMYWLARMLGPHPAVAAWVGLLFAMSGGLAARLHAGHLQKVLAMPLIPLVLACAVLVGRARTLRGVAFWAVLAGMIHGFTFLAGDTSIPLFLLVVVPIVLLIGARGNAGVRVRERLLVGLGGWGAGLVFSTAGKLIASSVVLAQTVRSADPYFGSQDSYWAFVHLAFPFFASVPGLQWFSYGVKQVEWGWGWWEYTEYIGVVPVVLAALGALAILAKLQRWQPFPNIASSRREVAALLVILVVASLWLANAKWYSPVHWLFEFIPLLENFRVPPRPLMVAAPAVLAITAVGLETVLRSTAFRPRLLAIVFGVSAAGAVWWVNTSWFKPLRWVCDAVPGLHGLPYPACAVTLVVVAVLALAAAGFWARRLAPERRQLIYPVVMSVIALIALVDLYHATQAIPRVDESRFTPSLRRIIGELKARDSGPFLIGLGMKTQGFAGRSGMYINKGVRFEFAERGIAVADDVSPLVPEKQYKHQVIGLDQRMRYRVVPDSSEFFIPEGWSRLMDDGEVIVIVNGEAQGDAWLVNAGDITPLLMETWEPGRFVLRTEAPAGATLVVPANPFQGWRVSIDGGPSRPAIEFDGYVATPTEHGEHTYELVYKQPMLPAVLVLGALPWMAVGALLVWVLLLLVRGGPVPLTSVERD